MPFLSKRKIKGKSIKHPFGEMDLPREIPESELTSMIQLLKKGILGKEGRDKLWKGHIRLAISIAGKYSAVREDKEQHELVAIAVATIGDAINAAPLSLKDDNFTPFCVTKIHGALSRYLNDDHVVRVPAETIRRKILEGKPLQLPKTVFDDASTSNQAKFVAEAEERDEFVARRYRTRKRIRIRERRLPEIKEMIEESIANPLEGKVISLREQGYTSTEISELLKLDKSEITRIRQRVEKRYTKLENE